MPFDPVIPSTDLSGFRFLQRTGAQQFQVFSESLEVARPVEYFKEVTNESISLDTLIEDRRIREVVLGAFDLADDIDNKFLIRKVLEEGTQSSDALANRFSDQRYRNLAEAFELYIPQGTFRLTSDFIDEISENFQTKQFEIAIGEQSSDFRVAYSLESELQSIADQSVSEQARWLSVLGSPPLLDFAIRAAGLPSEITSVDLDKQIEAIQQGFSSRYGVESFDELLETENLERVRSTFLALGSLNNVNVGFSGSATALNLLQSFSVRF